MRNGEPDMYSGICTLRDGAEQRQWNRMQAFLVFNSVAIPIAFGTQQSETVKLAISIVGFFVHTGLALAVWQAIRWLRFLDDALASLERLDTELDSNSAVRVAIFNSAAFEQRRGGKFRSRVYLIPFGIGAVVWLFRGVAHFFF